MFHLIALVKPFRAQKVLSALAEAGALSVTVREAKGFGRQKERLGLYLGSEYSDAFLPKIEVSAFLPNREAAEAAARAVILAARTGRMGDGKVFLMPCLDEHVSW